MADGIKLKDIEKNLKDMDIDSALQYLLQIEYKNSSIYKLIDKYVKKKECSDKEYVRFNKMLRYERKAYSRYELIAGIDEAGRGPLAGPVFAAAVILPRDVFIEKLNDSKQLSAKQRDVLYDKIIEKAVAFGVGSVREKEIDEINILQATKKAMIEAINKLSITPDLLMIDSLRLEESPISQIHIVRGDCLSASIAAASIIAKVTRDRFIEEVDSLYPEYGFAKNKGYGTKDHIEAIKKYGICPIHRVSFTKNFV